MESIYTEAAPGFWNSGGGGGKVNLCIYFIVFWGAGAENEHHIVTQVLEVWPNHQNKFRMGGGGHNIFSYFLPYAPTPVPPLHIYPLFSLFHILGYILLTETWVLTENYTILLQNLIHVHLTFSHTGYIWESQRLQIEIGRWVIAYARWNYPGLWAESFMTLGISPRILIRGCMM